MAQKQLKLHFETINQNNGLSNNGVNCLYKDDDGFLWVGTEDGLNKYDGSKFKVYRHFSNDSASLVGNQVMKIRASNAGRLWVSSHCWGLSELNIYSGKSIQHKENSKNKNSLVSNCDIDVLQDDAGNIWVKNAVALSLYHTKTKTFSTEFRVPFDTSIIHRMVYHKGILWLATLSGNIGYNVKTKQLLPTPLLFNKDAASTEILSFINDDIILSNGWERGLYINNIKQKRTIHFLDKLTVSDVKTVTINQQKQLWVTTNNGLYVANYPNDLLSLTEQSFAHYLANNNDVNAIPSNYLGQILQDDKGIVWIATSNGLCKFNPSYLLFQPQYLTSTTVEKKHFNYFPNSFSIHTNSSGKTFYWLSNWHGAGLLKVDTNFNVVKRIEFKHYEKQYALQHYSLNVSNIFQYGKDTLAITTWDGLWLYDELKDKLIEQFKFNDKDTSQPKRSRIDYGLKDKEGNIWVGTYNQKLRVLNAVTHNWKVFEQGDDNTKTKGDRNDFLFLDSKGRLWLSEVSYYDLKAKAFVKLKMESNASSIIEDKKGNIWLATENGIAKYLEATKEFKFYNSSNGLLANHIYNLLVDDDNNLWATSAYGLICINEDKNLIRNFTVADGLENNGLSGVLWKLPNGSLLISPDNIESKHFTVFNPKTLLQQSIDLPFHFTAIQIFNKERNFQTNLDSIKELHFRYNENLFSIHFKALEFANAANIRYRYKLINVSNQWIDIGNQDNITFTNLGYSKYSLLVEATSAAGVWMDKTLRMDLVIEPPFWRTNWFYTLVILCVSCIIFILVKRRIKTIKTKAALTQQLTDLEMKALRSQMNPHFIFNCLSSIQATIMQGETERATEYVDKFSLLLRTVLNQSERPTITLQEEIDYLTTYLELECFRYDDLQFAVNATNVEDAAFIHIPSMLLQPFIENAIQHGLSHKVGEKQIDILFEEAKNSITVTITDNGIGRVASKEINKNRTLVHQSLGIKNTEDRLKILFKDNKADVVFIDEEEGTTVIIQIPIINNQ